MAVIPVVAYQGTITLAAKSLAPFFQDPANAHLMSSINATLIPPELISLISAAWVVLANAMAKPIVSAIVQKYINRRWGSFMSSSQLRTDIFYDAQLNIDCTALRHNLATAV